MRFKGYKGKAPRSALSRQIREAVRIHKRGGEGSILNSRAEFNRCYIPRLVVEEEDEEAKTQRLQHEEQEIKELLESLELEDLGWEERKRLENELSKKKRRRESESLDDDRQVGERRKIKKLRYARTGEDWGADDSVGDGVEEPQIIEEGSSISGGGGPSTNLPAPEPSGGRSKKRKVSTTSLISSTIPEYFKKMRTIREDEDEYQEPAKTAPQEDGDDQDPWGTDSWEELAEVTMSALDGGVDVGEDTTAQEQPSLGQVGGEIPGEDAGMEEFGIEDSWEEFASATMDGERSEV